MVERQRPEEAGSGLASAYAAALRGYRDEGGEKWLQEAHDIGRTALSLGLGVLDIVSMHEEATGGEGDSSGHEFLREALSPFEMTHRGFTEANEELRRLNDSLQLIVDEQTEDLREQQRLSVALNEINDMMRSRTDSEVIMSDVLARGAETIGAESGSVAVADGGDWVVRYVWGHKPNVVGRRFTDDQNPFTRLAVERGKPLVGEDAQWESRRFPRVEPPPKRVTTIVAPIVVRGQTVAVLHFNHVPIPQPYTQAEIDFVEKLASSLSLALDDVLSFEAEHRIAVVLQEAILETPREIEGLRLAVSYASSTQQASVGGDFYDAFVVEGATVCFLIGDVSGKGIEAASVAAMTKNTIRVHAAPGTSPGEVLRLANDSMHRFTPSDIFVTVFVGLLDVRTGALTYASAGHPPGILMARDGSAEFLDCPATGLVLAAFRGSEYGECSRSLQTGEMVVLYTDGAIEVRCGGDFLGEEGFRDLLRPDRSFDPARLLTSALAEVKRCSGGELTDDIAMLAVRFDGV